MISKNNNQQNLYKLNTKDLKENISKEREKCFNDNLYNTRRDIDGRLHGRRY